MKTIDVSGLQPADILLTTTTDGVSKAIRAGTKSDISHALLYVATYSVIDSTDEGVQARNLQHMFYEDVCSVHALRMREPLAPWQVQAIVSYARAETGTPYTVKEALSSIRSPRGAGSAKQFCSRLIARAYATAGVKLVDNPDFCTPAQLKLSPLLQALPSPTVEVSQADLARRPRDGTALMRQVTNAFLNQARKLSPSINSIEDAMQFVRDNREYDEPMSAALQQSGYLDFWQYEIQTNSWRYNIELMLAFERRSRARHDLRQYCLDTLRDDKDGVFDHWKFNVVAATQLSRATGLRTDALQAKLYRNLVDGHLTRVETAQEWLAIDKLRQ